MIPYIISSAFAALAFICFYSLFSEGLRASGVASVLGSGLIAITILVVGGWSLDKMDSDIDARREEVAEWPKKAVAAGCKRTSYASSRYSVQAVWTCPDGQAYIQPN